MFHSTFLISLFDLTEVYLDESGDLGFSERSSQYLVIAATIASSDVNFDRIVKKVNRKLKIEGKCQAEVKFNNSDDHIRHNYIDRYCETGCSIVWCAVKKENVYPDLQFKKDKLYNYLCGKTMSRVFGSVHTKKFNVILDRRSGGRAQRNDIDRYLGGILTSDHMGAFPPELVISHYDSCNNAGLRVHDFVVGSIFQHVERGNSSYYDKLRKKVIWGGVMW